GGSLTSNSSTVIGSATGSTGVLNVDGGSASWISAPLSLGFGTMTISNAGKVVAARGITINRNSLAVIVVGDGSSLNVGTYLMTNDGTIRLKATPNLASGTYTPIIAANATSGSGTI